MRENGEEIGLDADFRVNASIELAGLFDDVFDRERLIDVRMMSKIRVDDGNLDKEEKNAKTHELGQEEDHWECRKTEASKHQQAHRNPRRHWIRPVDFAVAF